MTKKKLIITITSLCLVVVAAVAAVVGIIAATQVNVKSTLKITYTPQDTVYATVDLAYRKDGATSSTTIGTQIVLNYQTANNSTSEIPESTLQLAETEEFVIYEFTFKNTITADQDKTSIKITAPSGTFYTATNMNVKYGFSNAKITDWTYDAVSTLVGTGTTEMTIAKNATGYYYIAVQRQEENKGSFEATSSALAFVLSAVTPSA